MLRIILFFALATFGFASSTPFEILSPNSTWHIKTRHILSPAKSSQRCSFHQSPVIGTKQILEAVQLKSAYVHHIDLFRCTPPTGKTHAEFFDVFLNEEGYDCEDDSIPTEHCKFYEFWSCPYSPPSELERYPPNVGSAINEGEYLHMVVHYENPQLLEEVEVSTGIDFKYTPLTKAYQAGFIQVGRYVSFKNLIPPNSMNFQVPHKCTSDCTASLPAEIKIFGVTFHAHDTAKDVKLRHIRNGETISVIAHDTHYSPEQPFKFKKLTDLAAFRPGDELEVECIYDSEEARIGGNTLKCEMCIAFVEYYPKTMQISTCGTTLAESEIKTFFDIESFDMKPKSVNPTVTAPAEFKGLTFTDVVNKMDWTMEKRIKFQEIMVHGEKDAYCQT